MNNQGGASRRSAGARDGDPALRALRALRAPQRTPATSLSTSRADLWTGRPAEAGTAPRLAFSQSSTAARCADLPDRVKGALRHCVMASAHPWADHCAWLPAPLWDDTPCVAVSKPTRGSLTQEL